MLKTRREACQQKTHQSHRPSQFEAGAILAVVSQRFSLIMVACMVLSLGTTALTWHRTLSQRMVIRNRVHNEVPTSLPELYTLVERETKADPRPTRHNETRARTTEGTNHTPSHLNRHDFSPARRKIVNLSSKTMPPVAKRKAVAKLLVRSPSAVKRKAVVRIPRANLKTKVTDTVLTEKSAFDYKTWASIHAQCMTALSKSPSNAICCLKRIKESISIGISQKDRVELQKAGFGTEFINELPQTDIPRFNTCAVVSSASSLKKHKFGREIDAHDAVFRFNHALTTGYEDMVGSKTTIRIINSIVQKSFVISNSKMYKILRESNQKGDTTNVTFFVRDTPDERLFSNPNASASWNKPQQVVTSYLRLRRMGYKGYLNHPIFAILAGRTLLKSLGFQHSTAASSGFQGVILATLLCDYVTSYEVATNDVASRRSQYYFQSEGQLAYGYTGYHPIEDERIVLSTLGKQRPGSWVYDIAVATSTCKQK